MILIDYSLIQDMHGERDIMHRFVFPELKRRARYVNVDLVPIDLRWGIDTSEGSNHLNFTTNGNIRWTVNFSHFSSIFWKQKICSFKKYTWKIKQTKVQHYDFRTILI